MQEEDGLLELYMSYSYLPVEQHIKINQALNGIYSTLSHLTKPDWPDIELWLFLHHYHRYYYNYGDQLYTIPLCITSAHTGSSITLKFDIEQKMFPKITTDAKNNIEVAIPKWYAALLVAGALLKGGVSGYDNYLSIEKKRYEIQKIQLEVDKLDSQIKKEKEKTSSPALNSIEKNIQLFQQEINQPNVDSIKIDGVDLKNLPIA